MTEGNEPGGGQANSLIRFACSFCGQHIRIPQIHAGKKGKCPKCGKIVQVPQPPSPTTLQEDEPLRLKRDDSLPDFAVPVPAPEQSWHRGTANPADAVVNDVLRTETPPVQKPATILNVFTFPFSLAGIIHFLLFWLGPFILSLASRIGALVCYLQFLLTGLYIALYGYFFYYISSCIIASAKDERLAPDVTLENPPSFGDLVRRFFLFLGIILICFGPLILYTVYFSIRSSMMENQPPEPFAWRADPLYWIIYGLGMFFLPMYLLAASLFDSITAYNPVLIIGSIISTFFYYCFLVLLFLAIGVIMNYVGQIRQGLFPFFAWGIDVYLIFIASYILGQFFRRYEGKLNWEVKL